MKKEFIDLTWTRDFTLTWAEWWSKHMNTRLIQILGKGIDSQLSFFNGQLLETYRLVKESENFIKAVINIDPKTGFFDQKKIKRYEFLIDEIHSFIKKIHKNKKYNNVYDFYKIKKLAREMYPWYAVSYLLPQKQWALFLNKKYPTNAPEILERLIKARHLSEGTIEVLIEYWRAVAKQLLKVRNLPIKYVSFLTFTELEKMLNNKLFKPHLQKLRARSKNYIFYKMKVYTDIDIADFFKRNGYVYKQININTNTKEFKGNVSCKGSSSIKGNIQIILKNSDISKFKSGNILVTVMTNPYYIPAMKKAKAIITNEGGITCHAAIVSRELKIPCIIGTKIATQVLKDGDKVEVDANKGIIKIKEQK